MQYFSSLLREIQYRAINTYQLGRNFPANIGLCPDRKSLDAAAPGAGIPAAHRYLASGFGFFICPVDGLTPRLGSGRTPSFHPPRRWGGRHVSSTGVSKCPPPPLPASDILKNAITRLGLFLARLHPCAQSSHTYLFHRIARKVSKPLASPSEFPSQSSEAEASSVGELADMARCLRSGGEMQASIPAAGRGALPPPSRVKKPSWSPLPGGEAAPCHPFNFVRVFPGEENEIPALELAPPCQNGSDLCNHTRFSGYFISAVMRLCKPLKAKCFLLL